MYTRDKLREKTKLQLIEIILRLQKKKPKLKFDLSKHFVIADGTQGMRRGE